MNYEGQVFRPPSEHNAWILQATIGCSHNLCTYCDMYRDKDFRVRSLGVLLDEIQKVGGMLGARCSKVFVADGDALAMEVGHWLPLLEGLRIHFPKLRRVSCYATAINVLEKSVPELAALRAAGLTRLYIGPESGDPMTLKRLVKGATYEEHVEAAARAHAAGMEVSMIGLLGAGGVERSAEHAEATGRLVTEMNPEFFAALTLTVVPDTPLDRMQKKGKFELPPVVDLLAELRTMIRIAEPQHAVFRTNHASNYLPLAGTLPADKPRILGLLDQAISGRLPLRPGQSRGL